MSYCTRYLVIQFLLGGGVKDFVHFHPCLGLIFLGQVETTNQCTSSLRCCCRIHPIHVWYTDTHTRFGRDADTVIALHIQLHCYVQMQPNSNLKIWFDIAKNLYLVMLNPHCWCEQAQISECPSFSGVPKSQHFLRSPDHPKKICESPWRDSLFRETKHRMWCENPGLLQYMQPELPQRTGSLGGLTGWVRLLTNPVKLVGCLVIILCCGNYCQYYNIIIFEITSILSLIENDCHLFNCWGCYFFKIRTPRLPRGDVC